MAYNQRLFLLLCMHLLAVSGDFALFCGFVSEPIQRYDIYVGSLNSESFTRLPITISGVPNDVSYDPVTDKIYWIETLNTWTGEGADRMCTLSSSIGRCDYNGDNQEYLITGISTGLNCVGAGYPKIELDIESRNIYWVSQGANNLQVLKRATMDGKDVETIAEKYDGQSRTEISLEKDTHDIFWSIYDPGEIYRVRLDGTIETIISREWGLSGVAVDNQDGLFWTTYSPFHGIQTADLQGQNRSVLYQSLDDDEFCCPNDIGLYRNDIYFIQADVGTGRFLYRMKKDGREIPVKQSTEFEVRCFHIHDDKDGPQMTGTPLTSQDKTDQIDPEPISTVGLVEPEKTSFSPSRASPAPTSVHTQSDKVMLLQTTKSSSMAASASIGTFEFAVIGICVFIVVVIVVAVVVLLALKRRSTGNKPPNLTELERRVPNNERAPIEKGYQLNPARQIFEELETDRAALKIVDELGRGAFGVVHKAYMQDKGKGQTLVAVKGLKGNASSATKENFLNEIQLIIDIGKHPNILPILGCITSSEPYYLITEFMKYGDLLHFLRNSKMDEYKKDEVYRLTDTDQLKIASQIARGMEYLSYTRYYHGDLAARNILVGEDLVVKISDFGMADDIYTQGYVRMAAEERRPLKWVSLETNMEGRCSIESDVWSYGIVLYEIITQGDIPYPGMNGQEVLTKLQAGYRMEKPANCTTEMYEVMRQCWLEDPKKRPEFKKLVSTIDKMLSRKSGYMDVTQMYDEGMEDDEKALDTMDVTAGNAHYEHAISNASYKS